MNRADITELYYITPIMNIPSIVSYGILSNHHASRIGHVSVAMEEIQERRKDKKIPGARTLHDYANLYFDAHNPMLSKRRGQNESICILRINPGVLDMPGVIIADRNAASGYARFYPVTEGIEALDKDLVFARFWTHSDPLEEWRRKSIKCAEVLVPDRVEPGHILGAYVANETALSTFQLLNVGLSAIIKHDMFF
jgi:hypothetical protein